MKRIALAMVLLSSVSLAAPQTAQAQPVMAAGMLGIFIPLLVGFGLATSDKAGDERKAGEKKRAVKAAEGESPRSDSRINEAAAKNLAARPRPVPAEEAVLSESEPRKQDAPANAAGH